MKKIVITLGALIFSASVFASDFRFAYEASEFSSPEGFATFHDRLENAARSYCAHEYFKNGSLSGRSACTEEVMAIVIDEIGDKRLLAYVVHHGAQRG